MISNYLSNKIRILSFVLIILVILLHNNLIQYATGIEQFFLIVITEEITRIAVPLFFFFSGFLFFVNCTKYSSSWYFSKLNTRIKSLLIPYLLWSCIGFIFVMLIQIKLPYAYSSVGLVSEYSIDEILYSLLWQPVGCYQLWFIRDLFISVLLAPFFYYSIRFLKIYFLIALFFLWMNGIQYVVSIEALFYFTFGSYVAIYNKQLMEKKNQSKSQVLILGIVWFSVCIFIVLLDLNYIWHCIGICIGLLFIWNAYDLINNIYIERMKQMNLIYYTFFLYLLHEPIMTLIKSLMIKIMINKMCISLIYVITFFSTIICTYIIGIILKRKVPKIYSILTGQR